VVSTVDDGSTKSNRVCLQTTVTLPDAPGVFYSCILIPLTTAAINSGGRLFPERTCVWRLRGWSRLSWQATSVSDSNTSWER
jgi:hypothetical protein